jgi:hypothetical protein
MLLYPFGIPLAYGLLLYRHREQLNPPGPDMEARLLARKGFKDIRSFSVLYRDYEPSCW